MEMSSLFSSLPDIIALLPTLLYVMQILFYLFFIWFCGSMAMRGWKKPQPFITGLGFRFLTGVVCLVGGMSFSGFVPFFSSGFLSILQIDLLIAGVLVSILLALAMRLITHDGEGGKEKATLDALPRKVLVLEEMLRKGAKPLTEKEARKIAEGALPGYKAGNAKLAGNEWDIELKSGEKVGKVMIDAWDGEVKQRIKKFAMAEFFKDFHHLAGLLIIIAVLAAILLLFEGFPDPNDMFASMFGITMEDIADLSEDMRDNPFMSGNLPAGCVSPLIFSRYNSELQDKDFLLEHLHDDDSTKRTVEENSLDSVRLMIRVDHEGKDVIFAFTEGGKGCYLTDGKFCGCIDGQG